MADVPRLKAFTKDGLKRRLRIGTILACVGLLVLAGAAMLGVSSNMDRYGGHGVDATVVAARVTHVERVVSEEEQDGGFVSQERWFLSAEFQYDGETHEILLDEGYVDEQYARLRIGATMEVHVNTADFTQLHQRPVDLLFLVPAVIGLVLFVSGILIRFRYSDYRAHMLPSRRRRRLVSPQRPEYVMRRGRGI